MGKKSKSVVMEVKAEETAVVPSYQEQLQNLKLKGKGNDRSMSHLCFGAGVISGKMAWRLADINPAGKAFTVNGIETHRTKVGFNRSSLYKVDFSDAGLVANLQA